MQQHAPIPSAQSRWWQTGVLYQVYVRSFQDSNGDGVGDLGGVIERLDYLAWLGVDALWLTPFYPSPMEDGGYDILTYTDVDLIFGDLAMFDRLLTEAHRRHLRVLIDFVPNHTSDQHPWFLESRILPQGHKRAWYVWADARPDGSPPNNWLSHWGGSAWEWDAATSQYYLHSFHKKQPDLNWRNPEVRAAMFDVLRFWLERGVDGFRIDAAHFIAKDPELRDNPPNFHPERTSYKPLGDYDTQLHLYDQNSPDGHAMYRELRQVIDTYSAQHPRLALGEVSLFDWRQWASYYGMQLDELHLPFNFGLVGAPWQAKAVRWVIDAVEDVLPPGAWPGYVLGNHDEARIASRVGTAQARVAMLLLLTLRGMPTLYYGDEIGMQNGAIPPERVRDPWEKRLPGHGFGRDPERTPMHWNSSPNAGFCPSTIEPWLPIAEGFERLNVAVQVEDPHSMLALTRKLLQLRRKTPALTVGTYQSCDDVPDGCFVYLRTYGRQRSVIALNYTSEEQSLNLSQLGSGCVLLSTALDREGTIDLSHVRLRSNEGCVISLREEEHS